MSNNEEHQKPSADSIAGEFSGIRRSAIWGNARAQGEASEQELRRLPLEQVDPDPRQPRRHFDKKVLEELKASVESRGQLMPALVRPHPEQPDRFMLIAGERRYRVLKDLGRESLLAIVLPVSEQEARELALIDNLQRADLSPFEEAAGYQELIDDFGFTQEQIALKVGKDQTVVSNTLTINKLPENIRKDELAQQASKSVLLELARVSDPKELKSLWSSIKRDVKQGIAVTVRGVRDRRSKGGAKTPSPTPSEAPDKVVVASKQFSRQLAELTPDDLASSPERQETLRAIKERLDELFAGVPEVSPAPEERGEEEAVA